MKYSLVIIALLGLTQAVRIQADPAAAAAPDGKAEDAPAAKEEAKVEAPAAKAEAGKEVAPAAPEAAAEAAPAKSEAPAVITDGPGATKLKKATFTARLEAL